MQIDKRKARIASGSRAVVALGGGRLTSSGLVIPNNAAIQQFGTPTNMAPSENDLAFGYLLFQQKVEQTAKPPIKKR